MPESDSKLGAVCPAAVPEGFAPLQVGGPYFRQLGEVYGRVLEGGGVRVALRVAERHLNMLGVTHGGMLITLADGALARNVSMARGRRGAMVTVSMTADFLAPAHPGDWLEAHVTITRLGQRLAYASCDLKVAARQVLRASAVFAFVDRTAPGEKENAEAPLSDG